MIVAASPAVPMKNRESKIGGLHAVLTFHVSFEPTAVAHAPTIGASSHSTDAIPACVAFALPVHR